jgi:hypothetical protein
MTEDEALQILEPIRVKLGEYFDATQIHVSWVWPDGRTSVVHRGSGNYYARVGMTSDFLNREQAEVMAAEIRKDEEV